MGGGLGASSGLVAGFVSVEEQSGCGSCNPSINSTRGRELHSDGLPADMGLPKVLAVVAFLASSCAAMLYRTDSPCDFTDVTIDDEVFSRLIARLPEGSGSGPQGFHTLLPGFEVGRQIFEGLSKLKKFGPTIPFCAKGTRMVQADFFSDGDAHFWSPWKTCSGDEGRVTVRAGLTRFTLQFRVVESSASGIKLEFDRALPVTTQSVRIEVEGAGRVVRGVFEVLSALLPSFVEELWMGQIFLNINKGFRSINE
uniref:Metastriate one of each protein family n=1 Tax=Rhipicephalus appendiculatus TaxID=34631 RepID=A0A131YN35_RHIAP